MPESANSTKIQSSSLTRCKDAKCDKIYVDYLTGAKADRPEWQELLAYIREGGSRKKRVRRISGIRVDLMPGIRPYTLQPQSSGGSSSSTPSPITSCMLVLPIAW